MQSFIKLVFNSFNSNPSSNSEPRDDCVQRSSASADSEPVVVDGPETRLYAKYPDMFRMCFEEHSCMPGGIQISDGWLPIIEDLCNQMDKVITRDNLDREQFCFSQIKEKFGGLRVYMDCSSADINNVVTEAMERAAVTCEECGKPGSLREQYWMRTACDDCDREYIARQEERKGKRGYNESAADI